MGWSDAFVQTLKNNDVRFVTCVPDNVFTPLIKGVTSDNYFISSYADRREDPGVHGRLLDQAGGDHPGGRGGALEA
jgi:hypothetical protein